MSDHPYRVFCGSGNAPKNLAAGELHADVPVSILNTLNTRVRDLTEELVAARNEAARAHDRAAAAEKQCKQLIADMFKEAGGITGEVPIDLITADVLASVIRALRLRAGASPPAELASREKELARREAWVSILYPEACAQEVFDRLEGPPRGWVWHRDRPDDWNRRAEARWEALVAEYRASVGQMFRE